MIKDFAYLRPSTVQEALSYLAKHQESCKVICGGQSLLILMRQGLVATPYLVDIKHLKELNYIRLDAQEGLRIGATTPHRSIEKSERLGERFRVLGEMEKKLASIQIRNWGTIGGNLCHGDPASDPAAVLIALGARVRMASSRGERTMDLEDFFRDYFETALAPDELLLEIQVPHPPSWTGTAYEKFTLVEDDMGVVSVAVSITLDSGLTTCKEARIVLGNAGPTPLRAKEAEGQLLGEKMKGDLLKKVSEKASEEAAPLSDIHASEQYRRHLVKVLTRRMVEKAWEEARRSP